MSIMSVQIQCKSSLNQGLTDKLKGWNPMEEGGKNGPAQSFPIGLELAIDPPPPPGGILYTMIFWNYII